MIHPPPLQALQRALTRRVAIAAVLFVIVGFAVIASISGGNGANAPATAMAPPASAQSPAPSARVPEPEQAAAAAPAIEPVAPRPTASAAAGEPAAAGEETAAPAAAISSQSEQMPDRGGTEAPGSRDAAPGAMEPEPRSVAAAAGQPEAAEPPQPASAKPEPATPPAVRTEAAAKPGRGPRLQAGVFSQAANARALKAKLEAHGFPASIETRAESRQSRVYVGPFKDRKEADRAREKLRELGIATVLIAQ